MPCSPKHGPTLRAPFRPAIWIVVVAPRFVGGQVTLRNQRFEEHNILTENASFLQRNKKRRSHSVNTTAASASVGGDALALRRRAVAAAASTAAASATAAAAAMLAAAAQERDAADTEELLKPDPLNLSAIVAPGLAKNQGANAEEAFRAVGLTTVRRKGMVVAANGKSDGSALQEEEPPLSPPHLFWKAVVVAPVHSRGNVGAWLDAKFGGDGGAEGVAGYARDVASQGLCPVTREEDVLAVEGHEGDVGGENSGGSKLIYRALRCVGRRCFGCWRGGYWHFFQDGLCQMKARLALTPSIVRPGR